MGAVKSQSSQLDGAIEEGANAHAHGWSGAHWDRASAAPIARPGGGLLGKLLIANRGEIACRIAATARRLGVRTVAVYSTADAQAAHVQACDEAWPLGEAAAAQSYLRGEAILAVARASGARSIHPGYGFLAENADFAQACVDAGLIFIGPPAPAIAAMGSKVTAKALMAAAGVPVVPGYHGADQSPDRLAQEAARIGWPVLIKASAGGGGKGMRVVPDAQSFGPMLLACQREALASFGDQTVLLERYLGRVRHVEVQVFCDRLGAALWLSERDCSVQRRHQKVLEEAPAPGLARPIRQALGEAAIAAARAVAYEGAGTVEFLVDCDAQGMAQQFYFMEMNTRLQVEHPVTEMVMDLDLVEWQLRVAAGQALPCAQADLSVSGHAIEARIYAENPRRDFLPTTGRLLQCAWPAGAAFFTNAALRIDAGVRAGDSITPFYDPLIAKLIVRGNDRAHALERLRCALAQVRIAGLATNLEFLHALAHDQAFCAGDLDTQLLERRHALLLPDPQSPAPDPVPMRTRVALAAVAVLGLEAAQSGCAGPQDPWSRRDGWRMAATLQRTLVFTADGEAHEVGVRYGAAGSSPAPGSAATPPDLSQQTQQTQQTQSPAAAHPMAAQGAPGLTLLVADSSAAVWGLSFERPLPLPLHLAADIAGVALQGWLGTAAFSIDAVVDRKTLYLSGPGWQQAFGWAPSDHAAGPQAPMAGSLNAPMPGKVVALVVTVGDCVARGQTLLILEAMKMEHVITAPADGVVEAVHFALGASVAEGAVLLQIAPNGPSGPTEPNELDEPDEPAALTAPLPLPGQSS